MEKITRSFEEYLTSHNTQLSLAGVLINLIIAALLAYLLAKVYERYGTSLSNRRMFSRNFVLLAMTTMLIITIVKSSLALSLGLVGALSIIRFRTAIKEPEELGYIFITIAIGLGLGADQVLITCCAFALMVIIIIIKSYTTKKEENQNLLLSLTISNPEKNELEKMVNILKKYCSEITLRRFDESKDVLEAVFNIEFEAYDNLQLAKTELQTATENIRISFLGNNHNS